MNVLINLGPTASATTIWSAKVGDVSSIGLNVKAIVGSTVIIETSPDNSAWSTLAYVQNVTSGVPVNNAGTITVKGRYWASTLVAAFIRVRISAYVGPGNVDIEVDASTQVQRAVLGAMDVTAVAIGTTAVTALPIQFRYTRFATVAASTGAILPMWVAKGDELTVRNGGANALLVYPPVGFLVNGAASLSVAAGAAARFVSDGAGNYWSF